MTPDGILNRDDGAAAALIVDLERLVSRGLIVAVREPGGPTRYDVVPGLRGTTRPACEALSGEAARTVLDGG
jgi:hypothetical protein